MIPNAIDPDCFTLGLGDPAMKRAELGVPPGCLLFGTVARYTLQKDPLTLVRAVRYVLQECPDACFVWCGEGELRAATERLAHTLGVGHAIRFLGYRADAREIVGACDMFVLASLFEGLPYTLLEAMALARPIVGTDVIGIRDAVEDGITGHLVPPDAPEQVAQAVLGLARDPERRAAMGQAGSRRVRELFSLPALVASVEAVYRSLAPR